MDRIAAWIRSILGSNCQWQTSIDLEMFFSCLIFTSFSLRHQCKVPWCHSGQSWRYLTNHSPNPALYMVALQKKHSFLLQFWSLLHPSPLINIGSIGLRREHVQFWTQCRDPRLPANRRWKCVSPRFTPSMLIGSSRPSSAESWVVQIQSLSPSCSCRGCGSCHSPRYPDPRKSTWCFAYWKLTYCLI